MGVQVSAEATAEVEEPLAKVTTDENKSRMPHLKLKYDTFARYKEHEPHVKVRPHSSAFAKLTPASTALSQATNIALTCVSSHITMLVQRWASEMGHEVEFSEGIIEGRDVTYPVLLDSGNHPRTDLGNAFLLWYAEQSGLQKEALKFAQKYLTASANIECNKRDIDTIPKGTFNASARVQVAAHETRIAYGKAKLASGADNSKRADHLPTFEEMSGMMHLALSGSADIHPNPLRALQTGLEVRITHTTGVRGQLVRSASFRHFWPRDYRQLAHRAGIRATVMCASDSNHTTHFHHHHHVPPHPSSCSRPSTTNHHRYNDSGDKTHIVGDASHAGFLPSRNALLSPSAFGGLSLLYRFCHQGEPFPDVCKDNGLEYKSMPLIKPERQVRSAESKADAKVQNSCFNALYAAAGVEMYANDAVTHAGRHACQQEAKDSGLDGRLVDEALGYQIKDVQKDQYAHRSLKAAQSHRMILTVRLLSITQLHTSRTNRVSATTWLLLFSRGRLSGC